MNARIPLALAFLLVLSVGCGREQTPPRALTPQEKLQQAADQASQAAQQTVDKAHKDWNDLTRDFQTSLRDQQDAAAASVQRQKDDLAEFAAEMAEDAKDRALDIPDVLDEFFGDATSSRHGRRSNRPRR